MAVDPKVLLSRFQQFMRYRTAESWRKPFINPVRFVRNQIRKGMCRVSKKEASRVETFHCNGFQVINGEWVSEEIAGYGVYEPELTEALLRIVQPGSVVMDVGMHLGYYSTLFAALVGSDGLVIAFEPTPSTRAFATSNTSRFSNIQVRPEALWSSGTLIDFNDYGIKWMAFNGAKSAKVPLKAQLQRTLRVNCVTLDAVVQQLGKRVSLIKIDAESAELEILKGGQEFLKQDKPLISMEIGDQEGERSSEQALGFATSLGYKIWEVTGSGLIPHQFKSNYSYGNVILAEPGWIPPG